MQPVIVRGGGGGERGNLSWTRDQHPIWGGGGGKNK